MLSRHFLRAKVLQAVYSCQIEPATEQLIAIEFQKTLLRLNDLGVWQLSTLLELQHAAELFLEEASQKFHPTEEDLNPSHRLPDNRFLAVLKDNFSFRKQCERLKINWADSSDVFRRLFVTVRASQVYRDYVASDDNYENDKLFVLQIFKCLMNDDALRDQLYRRDLLWEDDFDQVAQYNFMMLKALPESFDEASPMPLMHDDSNESDVEALAFARKLLADSLHNREEAEQLIKSHLKGWDFDRVAQIDVLLITMAITEFTSCPSIPERVTVDEYIELSKEFSTDRSKLFINGILDKLIVELRSAGRIQKSGRGLFNPDLLNDESNN